MAKFRIKFNTKRLESALKKSPKIVSEQLQKGMLRAGIVFGQRFKKERLSNKSVQDDGLQSRTGFLKGTIRSETKGSGKKITSIVSIGSSAAKYAKIHEFGGTIKAKDKMLTFAPDSSPLRKKAARTTKRPNTVPNLVYIPIRKKKGDRLGLWVKKKKGKERGPIFFISVDKVKIPARLGWIKAFKSEKTEKIYEDNVRRAITKGLRLSNLGGA